MHSLNYALHNDSPFLPSQKKRGKGAQVTNFLSNKRIIIKKYFNVTFLSDNFRRNAFLFAIDITMLLHYFVRIGFAPIQIWVFAREKILAVLLRKLHFFILVLLKIPKIVRHDDLYSFNCLIICLNCSVLHVFI